MPGKLAYLLLPVVTLVVWTNGDAASASPQDAEFFERRIRPILVEHCYECHSEDAGERQGGLLLDRESGWRAGGDRGKAVVPGEPESSLLIKAVRYDRDEIQMPPEYQLEPEQIQHLEQWVRIGAPGPQEDLGATAFSRLGDQEYLFQQATTHWAFQPIESLPPPEVDDPLWNRHPIDRFIYRALTEQQLQPSAPAVTDVFVRRLMLDVTGLPPNPSELKLRALQIRGRRAAEAYDEQALTSLVDELLMSPEFGEHLARLWLDVARYADTDSFYRPDTRTPHFFPFAFTYRDYVIASLNRDKPFDQFVREQLAADLIGFKPGDSELAALGFLAVGPHANRNSTESVDDWIDLTTRGLMGLTVACARCHDHKYEPIPTADYYSLHGVFASIQRPSPIDETKLPAVSGYEIGPEQRSQYAKQRASIDKKISDAVGKKSGNNNRSLAQRIRETELAELLLFHPGAPAHAMVVQERAKPVNPFVFVRGDPTQRGPSVPRRFLRVLENARGNFPDDQSGRSELAERIVSSDNPLTARVFVNRVWGYVMGRHLVETPSDFGLQGSAPSHPQLLDWLAADFVANGWSIKHLVRTIVTSQTYRQSSDFRQSADNLDTENRYYWRAHRKRLSVETLRDCMLAVSGQLERSFGGRPASLWGDDYSRRRSIYGYVNRFNLDPTLRVFDFPSRMQTHPDRDESIVAPQALFTMNAPFVIDQAVALTNSPAFLACETDEARITSLFQTVYLRDPVPNELLRFTSFLESQQRFFEKPLRNSQIDSAWPIAAQALLMSNEFQYVD